MRRRHLWCVLIGLLALWAVDGGLSASRTGAESTPLVNGPADRALLPPVSAPPPPSWASAGETDLRGAPPISKSALVALLRDVNPSLGDREADRIATAVLRSSAKYRLAPDLVTAVLIVESGARPWARSPKGAVGLMQVMPHMMEPLRLAGNSATIESNIEAGCWILAGNIGRLGEADGISGYFWGSSIRGSAYLQKVRATQEIVRRHSLAYSTPQGALPPANRRDVSASLSRAHRR